jgi:hypothetical protein
MTEDELRYELLYLQLKLKKSLNSIERDLLKYQIRKIQERLERRG